MIGLLYNVLDLPRCQECGHVYHKIGHAVNCTQRYDTVKGIKMVEKPRHPAQGLEFEQVDIVRNGTGNDAKEPVYVHCGGCKHEWPVVYTPMDISKFNKVISGACCPMCGEDKKSIMMGKVRN